MLYKLDFLNVSKGFIRTTNTIVFLAIVVWEAVIFISVSSSEAAKAISTDSPFSPTFFYSLEYEHKVSCNNSLRRINRSIHLPSKALDVDTSLFCLFIEPHGYTNSFSKWDENNLNTSTHMCQQLQRGPQVRRAYRTVLPEIRQNEKYTLSSGFSVSCSWYMRK